MLGIANSVVVVTELDFLIGKDRICAENGGNNFLKQLVAAYFEEYQSADAKSDYTDVGLKRSKSVIAREIVNKVKHSGGRFLKRHFSNDKSSGWREVSEREEANVVIGAFRNHKRNLKKRAKKAMAKSDLKDPPKGMAQHIPESNMESSKYSSIEGNEPPFQPGQTRVEREFDERARSKGQGAMERGASMSTCALWGEDEEPIDNFCDEDDKLGDLLASESSDFAGGPLVPLDWFADHPDGEETGTMDGEATLTPTRQSRTTEDSKPPANRRTPGKNDIKRLQSELMDPLAVASIAPNNNDPGGKTPSRGSVAAENPTTRSNAPTWYIDKAGKYELSPKHEKREPPGRAGFEATITRSTANPDTSAKEEAAHAMLELNK